MPETLAAPPGVDTRQWRAKISEHVDRRFDIHEPRMRTLLQEGDVDKFWQLWTTQVEAAMRSAYLSSDPDAKRRFIGHGRPAFVQVDTRDANWRDAATGEDGTVVLLSREAGVWQRDANRLTLVAGHITRTKQCDPTDWPKHVRGAWASACRRAATQCPALQAAIDMIASRSAVHRIVIQVKAAAQACRRNALATADACRSERRKQVKQKLHDKHSGLGLAYRIMMALKRGVKFLKQKDGSLCSSFKDIGESAH